MSESARRSRISSVGLAALTGLAYTGIVVCALVGLRTTWVAIRMMADGAGPDGWMTPAVLTVAAVFGAAVSSLLLRMVRPLRKGSSLPKGKSLPE